MNDEKEFALPCIGLAKKGDKYLVVIRETTVFYSIDPDTARYIAADILVWADRVEKLNAGDEE